MFSKTASSIFIGAFILFILGVMAFLDTAQVEHEEVGSFLTSYTKSYDIEETAVDEENEKTDTNLLPSILEDRLVNTEIVDGYLVEEYREYEIYKNKEGVIVKTVPTSNYNYIRYSLE